MILVDTRAGSSELVAPLAKAGLPVEEAVLEYGDIAFLGRGEGGADVMVGIEHKKVPDLVGSLNSDRLVGHQLGGMLDTYDRPYLLIEGDWDHDDAGHVTLFRGLKGRRSIVKGAPLAVELEKRVITLETRGGLRVRWTPSQRATVRYLTALYRFWTDRDLDMHRSHLAIHSPDLDRALKIPISLKRQIAAQLPGIGFERSRAVDQHFRSVWEMVNAGEEEWRRVEGIGPALSRKLVAACRDVEL